ncbi:hypothetical protein [Halorhabdus salina]|uniref:hypothetical protein n=1 Tax=Halorhabdus salina TaxID=2750670 RepID=UPI0015EE59B7|nr:hypothetical protein [Halorhabdus salina]
MSDIVDSLPEKMLPYETVNDLEESDNIVQSVPVRGLYTNNSAKEIDAVVFQILLNIPGRGLVGLHIDPYEDNSSWKVVFDSQNVDDAEDSEELYVMAHSQLLEISPELEGKSFFEHTPEFKDIGLMDYPDRDE